MPKRAAAGSQGGMQQRSCKEQQTPQSLMSVRRKCRLKQQLKSTKQSSKDFLLIATDVAEASSGDEQVLVVQAGKGGRELRCAGMWTWDASQMPTLLPKFSLFSSSSCY